MNDDESALVRAVCADPTNDLPRLVLADWWDEHGQPDRAEFVRVQCELAATYPAYVRDGVTYLGRGGGPEYETEMDRHFNALRRRELDLLQHGPVGDANWARWFGMKLPDAAVCDNLNRGRTPSDFRFTYGRGFVESVRLPLAAFMGVAAALFACQSVTAVTLSDRGPRQAGTQYPDGGPPWGWSCYGLSLGEFPDELPPELWALLGGERIHGWKYWPTRAAALDALSASVVAWARKLAGLPPLKLTEGAAK